MLVTQRQYPVLGYLNAKSLNGVGIHKTYGEEFMENKIAIQKLWVAFEPIFSSNINILSKPFAEAFESAKKSLAANLSSYLDSFSESIYGTIINGKYTICYYIKDSVNGYRGEADFTVFSFWEGDLILVTYTRTKDKSALLCPQKEAKSTLTALLAEIILFDMFKKYAKIETKELPANKKVKDFHCKYINQTNVNVTILDSTWFTNLVKSDAFKVRGHFRLQPKKHKGQWTKELIWINEFAKNGYSRQAKKLTVYQET